jgi:hypothetical protein
MKKTLIRLMSMGAAMVSTQAFARIGDYRGPDWSLGLELGSSSLFGNGITGGWRWFDLAQWDAGIGFNSSGIKIGIGHSFMLNFTRTIGMSAGAAFTYSTGHDGEVELEAQFTPDGSRTEETITATKSYSLTPAPLLGVQTGMYWDMERTYRFSAKLCYSVALSGNQVSMGKRTTYSKPVELANEDEFNGQFDRKAEDVVRAGGLGFALGAAILF